MPDIRSLLKSEPLLTDGAFGTYFQQQTGRDALYAESANMEDAAVVTAIHREYLDAGARLIRANTFAAHPHHPALPAARVGDALKAGFALAAEAAERRGAWAAASVGPLPSLGSDGREFSLSERTDSLLRILDTLCAAGARHFVFETWSSTELPGIGTEYLKKRDPGFFVLCQCTVLPDGKTRQGVPLRELWSALNGLSCDAVGLNCGCGPAHMLSMLEGLPRPFGRPVSALPNAGYPRVENGRTQYSASADYFADAARRMRTLGILLPGGCCGTTPRHIAAMARALERPVRQTAPSPSVVRKPVFTGPKADAAADKPIAVELEPPRDGNAGAVIRAAESLRRAGADLITLPDSPLGRSRMNAVMLASLVIREAGVPVMPHLTCRDRNLVALQSDLLGAWAGGVRHILLVTGDPVAAGSRDEIREVFNTHSIGLLSLACQLNRTVFREDPIELAAACNPHAARLTAEARRMQRKADEGARKFFSQPIFDEDAVERLRALGRPAGCQIFAGVMPAVSRRNALFLQNEVPGLAVPDQLVRLFTPDMDREAAEEASVAYTAGIGRKALAAADGLYIVTPFNRIGLIEKLIAMLRDEYPKEKTP